MSRASVICAGRLYADLVFTGVPQMPEPGKEVFCGGLTVSPGGGAVITAAYLAARGLDAHLMSSVPRDPFGSELYIKINELDVKVDLSRMMPPGADPQLTVAIVQEDDRAFLTRRWGAALPADALERIALSDARHLHIGELATLVEHPGLLGSARGAGMTISLDCSWDQAVFGPAIAELIAAVDVFLPNEKEAQALQSTGLSAPFAPLTVIKCGAAGARAISANGHWQAQARPVTVVDTIGAGDAFNAGFLEAWLGGAGPEACLRQGVEDGTQAVQHAGGVAGALHRISANPAAPR